MNFYIYKVRQKCFGLVCLLALGLFSTSCKTQTETASERKLLDIDSASITGWELIPGKNNKTDAYKIVKKENAWMIELNNGKTADVNYEYLKRSFRHLLDFKAVAELNIPQEKWDTMAVSDNGTKLIIYKNGKPAAEIFIGNMFFRNSNKTAYYVRPANEKKIYIITHYLDGSLKAEPEKFRKKEMVPLMPSQFSEVMFLKPEGINYALRQAGQNAWSIDSYITNDSVTSTYMQKLSKLEVKEFADEPTRGADLSIQITHLGMEPVSIRAYRKNNETWIISSSANKGNYMEVTNQEVQSLFPPKDYFIKQSNK